MQKIIIAVFVILAFIPIYDSYADHNHDPRYPDTYKERGYNKENCEKMQSATGGRGIWLGHELGCQIDGLIINEFDIYKAPKKTPL